MPATTTTTVPQSIDEGVGLDGRKASSHTAAPSSREYPRVTLAKGTEIRPVFVMSGAGSEPCGIVAFTWHTRLAASTRREGRRGRRGSVRRSGENDGMLRGTSMHVRKSRQRGNLRPCTSS
jgi:hypothetical protein